MTGERKPPPTSPDSAHQAFSTVKHIKFHHCDPAGIVFFPQFFVLIHELLEDWFTQGLETDYAKLISSGVGLPAVRADCEFLRPCPMGTVLTLTLQVRRVGRTSVELAIDGAAANKLVLRATLIVVYVSLQEMRPLEIPADIRMAMLRFAPQT